MILMIGVRRLEYSVRHLEYLHRAIITSIIRTFRLISGWLPAQRGPDNRGSTVQIIIRLYRTSGYFCL